MKNYFRPIIFIICTFLLLVAGFKHLANTKAATASYVEGTLRTLVEDNFASKISKERYYVQQDSGQVTEIAVDQKIDIKPGSRIKVAGRSVELISAPSSQTVPSNISMGNKHIAVILANFTDLTTTTPSNTQAKVAMDTRFSPLHSEMSFGKSSFTATVYGWVNMNMARTCELSRLAPAAIAAADSQINYNSFSYVMIVFPNLNCPYGGIAYYPPGVIYNTAEGRKTIQVSALPNDYFNDWIHTVGNHEIGHSLGLRHANGWECGSLSIGANCTSGEYDDEFDIMGETYNRSGHFGSYYKEFLGWLAPQNVHIVTSSGNYLINKLETISGGIQSLKIPIPGTTNYYNVENRTATGSDSTLPANALNGALIKIIPNVLTGNTTGNSNIIDSRPNSRSDEDFDDAGFVLNQSFVDNEKGISITPVSKINGVLDVRVNFFTPNYTPNLLAPLNGQSTISQLFDWTDVAVRTNYTIQIALDSNFSNLLVNNSVVDSYFQAPNLPLNTRLYWRVRTNHANGSSDWTPTYSVTILPDKDTLGVFRPSNGAIFLKNKNSTGFADLQINYGIAGDKPIAGDWNGDGVDTIGVHRNGVFYLRNSNTVGFADITFAFGAAGDQPVAGDWNKDGRDSVGVYRNGIFFLRNSNSSGAADLTFGLGTAGDVAIAGDWNGDGTDSTGVFRASSGAIFLKNQNTTGIADIQINFGIAGDKPVAGDWNNDGKDTIGVYRNGTFFLRNSNTVGFADIVFALGITGDHPIAGNWDGLPR